MFVLTIIGARPQFIKAAMVSRELKAQGVHEVIAHTGQHYDVNMSDIFFDELDLPQPTHNLGIGGGSHGQNTGRMIEAIERILLDQKPDWVLVYGDTTSTLAGALAAVKLHIPVAHVEAGLRSFNRRMPEEINRILTDHAANLLFVPTTTAAQHLAREGIIGDSVLFVGDVMYDAALHFGHLADTRSNILATIGLEPKAYTLATIHRAENTDEPKRLRAIFCGFADFSEVIVLPIHPRTRLSIEKFGITLPPNVQVIDPVGYIDMVMLEKNAALIATDSGGVQKEAFFHRVPCVTLRDETEWTELVEAGWNHLAPPSSCSHISEVLKNALGSIGNNVHLYGEGHAAFEIVQALLRNCPDD